MFCWQLTLSLFLNTPFLFLSLFIESRQTLLVSFHPSITARICSVYSGLSPLSLPPYIGLARFLQLCSFSFSSSSCVYPHLVFLSTLVCWNSFTSIYLSFLTNFSSNLLLPLLSNDKFCSQTAEGQRNIDSRIYGKSISHSCPPQWLCSLETQCSSPWTEEPIWSSPFVNTSKGPDFSCEYVWKSHRYSFEGFLEASELPHSAVFHF